VKFNHDTPLLALWLDPEAPLADGHARALTGSGWTVQVVDSLATVLAHAHEAQLLVLRTGHDLSRLQALREALHAGLRLPVLCRIETGALQLAAEAVQHGAFAVLASDDDRPESWQRALAPLEASLAQQPAPEQAETLSPALPQAAAHGTARPTASRQVVFVDPASQQLLALARKVAQADVTALLVGPTGAGKEVLARVLHEASARSRGPFVALNCAAMPDHLIEDMLFGHDKGAFTGAHRDHKGLFEQAQGGTLFLDEIGEMPMHLQSKLLRVLQERQLTRLGGQGVIALNVRIVAATNKDLRQAIADKEFREDLYYRIATFRMRLLPLRERPGDILPLALQMLHASSADQRPWQIHPQAQAQLLQYPWPGNVRELENVMRRVLVLCPDRLVLPEHLMFDDWLDASSTLPQTTALSAVQARVEAALPTAPAAQAQAQAETPSVAHSVAMAMPPLGTTPTWPSSPTSPSAPDAGQTLAAQSAALMAGTPTPSAAGIPSAAQAQDWAAPDLHSAARQTEHQIILATLASTPSKLEAARRLGISPRTLRYKLAQMRDSGLQLQAA